MWNRSSRQRRLTRRVYVIEMQCGKWFTTSLHLHRACPACDRHLVLS